VKESTPMLSSVRPFWRSGTGWTGLAPWAAPLLVALAVAKLSDHRIEYVIAAGLGLLLVAWVYRHPGVALSALAVLVAVQGVLFGFLYSLHVPAFALRAGGGLKDLLALGILVSAVAGIKRSGRRLDAIDKLALAYVAVTTAYLLLPGLFAPLSPSRWSTRLVAWRLDDGYILLFFALRHAPISKRARRWFLRVVLGLGALIVAFAAYQYVSPHGFENLITNRWKQAAYEQNVLHSNPLTITSTLQYLISSSGRVHVGSILLSPFDMADYLVLVAAILVESLVRGARHWTLFVLLGGVVFALFVSQVRADAVALLVVVVFAMLPARGRTVESRWALVLIVLIGAALVVPSLGGTRFLGGGTGAASVHGHIRELSSGWNDLVNHPLGLGLGNNPVTSNRFLNPGSGAFISDNSYLQVGDELGVLALAAWLPLVIATLLALRRRARAPDAFAAAAGLALLGVLVAGFFHHVFLNFSTAWTVWPLAGLGLFVPGHLTSTNPIRREVAANRLVPSELPPFPGVM
jgi:hypothetical protein